MSFYQTKYDASYNYSCPNDTKQSSCASSKDQITLLEEKLSNYEMQYTKQNSALNEQLKQLLRNDSQMKKELENKGKALYQTELRLKETSAQLLNLQSYQHQTEVKSQEMYQRHTELTLEYKNASLMIQTLEEENGQLKATVEQLDAELSMKSEEVEEAKRKCNNVESILQETKANTELMTKESNTIKEMVNDCQKENSRMTQDMHKAKHELEDKSNQLVETKRTIEQLQLSNDQLKSANDAALKAHSEALNKIEQLEAKLLKTMEKNDKACDTTKRKEDEIISRNKAVEEMESNIVKRQIDMANLMSIANENIEAICRWIENYFDGNYKNNDILPELKLISYIKPKSSLNSKSEPIDFSPIKDMLKTAKVNYDKIIANEEKRLSELQKSFYAIERENAEKQKALQGILCRLQSELGQYAIHPSENNRGQCSVHPKETLMIKIEHLLDVLLSQPKGNDHLHEDFSVLIEQLKEDNAHLCYEASQLHSELNYLKAQLNSSSDVAYQLSKLNEEKMSMEKRNKYLLNEIELKKAQIKSQEQMLSRRMNEESIVKQVELDKDNLIKDNLMLIAQNEQLKEQLRYYQTG